MRLVILLGKFGSGGTERFVATLTRWLPPSIDPVIVVTDERADYAYRGNLQRLALPQFTRRRQYFRHVQRWWISFFSVRKVLKEKPSTVLAFTPGWAFLGVLFSDDLIFSLRVTPSAYYGTDMFRKLQLRFICSRARAIVCNSIGSKVDLEERYGIRGARVIYNPIDLAHIAEAKTVNDDISPKKIRTDTPVIISVGRAAPQKNHELLIRAFARVHKVLSCRLIIEGEGVDRDQSLRSLVDSLGLTTDVELAGFDSNPFRRFSYADVFVLSSRFEGFPNALVEAMACGLPVISTDCPSGPREILAPETSIHARADTVEFAQFGVLVPSNEEGALADAMHAFLADRTLRERYAAASRERVRDFAASSLVRAWFTLLAGGVSVVTFANLGTKWNLKTADVEPVIDALSSAGVLQQVVCQRHRGFYFQNTVSAVPAWRYYLRRLLEVLGLARPLSREAVEYRFDAWAARRLERSAEVVVSIPFDQTLRAAKAKGSIVIGIAEVAHPAFNKQINKEESARLGISEWEYPGRDKPSDYVSEFDHLITLSESAKRTYVESGYPAERISVAALDVDTIRFSPAEGRHAGSFRFLYIGYTTPLKGLSYLLDAWTKAALPNAELVLAGDWGGVPPELQERYERQIHMDTSSVAWIGGTTTPEALYQSADVFVFPSLTEGFGRVTLEAMACGLPVVTTENAQGIVEDGKTGFIVPIRDADALAEKIRYLYGHREEAAQMGKAARRAVENKKPFGEAVYEICQNVLSTK